MNPLVRGEGDDEAVKKNIAIFTHKHWLISKQKWLGMSQGLQFNISTTFPGSQLVFNIWTFLWFLAGNQLYDPFGQGQGWSGPKKALPISTINTEFWAETWKQKLLGMSQGLHFKIKIFKFSNFQISQFQISKFPYRESLELKAESSKLRA